MKTKTLLMTAVMLLCFSAVASAQAIYSVSSTPMTTVISTGNAELAGNITFTAATAGSAAAGTITIYYGGANITTPFSSITITGAGVTVNSTASTYSPGSLVLNIAAGSGTFTVSNVRVAISGTGLTSLVATISASGTNTIAAGSASVTLINSTTGTGIASVASYGTSTAPVIIASASTSGLPSINAVSGAFDVTTNTTTMVVVKEGFLSAFQAGVGARVTVSATPPKGVTFTFPTTANSYDSTGTNAALHNWVLGSATTTTAVTSQAQITSSSTSSSSLRVNYYVATDTGLGGDTTVEYLEIPVTAGSTQASETFPLTARQFTYTVSLAPVVDAYTSSSTPYSSPAPRFTASESTAANLAAITGRTTALFIPYGSTMSGFDTAITISNTTYDPGATLLGVATAAAPQSGTITFYFFKVGQAAGYTIPTYTTATVNSGDTYVAFLSTLVAGASPAITGGFSGYVIAVTNFTNAQGVYVISNFTNLALQSGPLGILSDRSVLPERGIW